MKKHTLIALITLISVKTALYATNDIATTIQLPEPPAAIEPAGQPEAEATVIPTSPVTIPEQTVTVEATPQVATQPLPEQSQPIATMQEQPATPGTITTQEPEITLEDTGISTPAVQPIPSEQPSADTVEQEQPTIENNNTDASVPEKVEPVVAPDMVNQRLEVLEEQVGQLQRQVATLSLSKNTATPSADTDQNIQPSITSINDVELPVADEDAVTVVEDEATVIHEDEHEADLLETL